jgi:gluconokinase
MIIVVMGVAGSGKTTVGTMLAAAMKCAFLEGDSLHSKENINKMSHGIPMTDHRSVPIVSTEAFGDSCRVRPGRSSVHNGGTSHQTPDLDSMAGRFNNRDEPMR